MIDPENHYRIELVQYGKHRWAAHLTVGLMMVSPGFYARTKEKALKKAEKYIAKDRATDASRETRTYPA